MCHSEYNPLLSMSDSFTSMNKDQMSLTESTIVVIRLISIAGHCEIQTNVNKISIFEFEGRLYIYYPHHQ